MSAEILDRGAARELAPDSLLGDPGSPTAPSLRSAARPRGTRAAGRRRDRLVRLELVGGRPVYRNHRRCLCRRQRHHLVAACRRLRVEILVGDNQFVKAGQLLITLDDRDYKANLAHAEAVVQNQRAALANLHAKYTLQQIDDRAGPSPIWPRTRPRPAGARGCRPLPCAGADHFRLGAETTRRRSPPTARRPPRCAPARPASTPPSSSSR